MRGIMTQQDNCASVLKGEEMEKIYVKLASIPVLKKERQQTSYRTHAFICDLEIDLNTRAIIINLTSKTVTLRSLLRLHMVDRIIKYTATENMLQSPLTEVIRYTCLLYWSPSYKQ